MTDIERRIRSALHDSAFGSWMALIQLYGADPEAFYILACDGEELALDGPLRDLADMAVAVRKAIHETYEIVPNRAGAALTSASGLTVPVPGVLVTVVSEFLRVIDGKTTGDRSGKDYDGRSVSEAECRFMLRQ